jgi:DNA-binding response OmpR family regulator
MRAVSCLPDADLDAIESEEYQTTLDLVLADEAPSVVLLDWDLPGCDGPELCRLVRAYYQVGRPYIILLARKDRRLAEGLEAGADDCVHVPAPSDELQARIRVGLRFASASHQSSAAQLVADTSLDDAVEESAESRSDGISALLSALISYHTDDMDESRADRRIQLDSVLAAS